MHSFQKHITVVPADIDAMNHVNNVVYLQWVQDVAQAHWIAKTTSSMRDRYAWVVINHFIEYKNPAFESEEILLETWIDNYTTATCERHTKITRKTDNTLLARAKTLWCLLDK